MVGGAFMRPSFQQWAINMAVLTAARSTCVRRQVGCILVNRHNHVIATGYNGVAAGMNHCNEANPCAGASAPSGTDLDLCEAIHAEQNALLQCHDVHTITRCYCTTAPCITCVKLLLNTSCREIIFLHAYPHTTAALLWMRAGREWTQHTNIE